MSEKYEYVIHTWGGFFNPEHAAKHGLSGGYYWFDTAEDRVAYLFRLRALEVELSARELAYALYEGTDTRLRTVARLNLQYDSKVYEIEYDFGYAYPHESAVYMFSEGNYSCDCNLSAFIRAKYPEFTELDCGSSIETIDLSIESIAD